MGWCWAHSSQIAHLYPLQPQGFEQAAGSLLGRGCESGTAKALPAASQIPSAPGENKGTSPRCCRQSGLALSSCIQSLALPRHCNPKVVATASHHPSGVFVLAFLPPAHHQTMPVSPDLPFPACRIKSLLHSRSIFLFVSNSTSLPKPCFCPTWLDPTTPSSILSLLCSEYPPYQSGGWIPIPGGFWG